MKVKRSGGRRLQGQSSSSRVQGGQKRPTSRAEQPLGIYMQKGAEWIPFLSCAVDAVNEWMHGFFKDM